MNRLRTPLFLFVIAISLMACATVKSRAAFDEALERYNKLIRWGDLDRAAVYASPAVSQEFWDRVKASKDARVTDYQVVDVKYDEKTEKASAVVTFSYYRITSGLVRKVTDNQKWAYIGEGEGKGWKLMSLPPEFR
jgi:hypothetical protein